MTTVIQLSCFLLLQLYLAFSEVFPCTHRNVGAVQLYNGEGLPSSQGYVIVCVVVPNYKGEYTTYVNAAFCWDGNSTFNEEAAAAACRQGGYSKHAEYNSGNQFPITNSSNVNVNHYINGIQCPVVKNHVTEGETVLLRCPHTRAQPVVQPADIRSACPTAELAAVRCDEKSITSNESTYNGQVYISSLQYLAEPTHVQINLDGHLLPICFDENSNLNLLTVGRSICQQLGYTNVTMNRTISGIKDAWYLGSLLCDSASPSCFTGCFNHSNYSKVVSCDDGDKVGLKLLCSYNNLNSEVYELGGGKFCEIEETNPTSISDTDGHDTTSTLLGVLIGVAVVAIAVMLLVLICIRWCRCLRNICCCCPCNWNNYIQI